MMVETTRIERITPHDLVGATVVQAYETTLRCGGRAGIRLRLKDGREIDLSVTVDRKDNEPMRPLQEES